jgi:hypothetical protein
VQAAPVFEHLSWAMTWRKMFHYYRFNRDEFLTHYQRSNAESTFAIAMIKAKFGSSLRSKRYGYCK